MTVEIWTFERSDKSHEKAALLRLARALDGLTEPFLMICNPVFYGQEVDALVLKRKMVFVVEIKSADGPITGSLYGDWVVHRSDGATWLLNGGRDGNPYQQIQREYRATLDFLKKHTTQFMTPAEAAQVDFRKIKNVLVLDPHYDAAASKIDLEDKDRWMNIVGLQGNVAEPFWRLEDQMITLTWEHMQALVRDILKCRHDTDMERLIRAEPEIALEEPETEEIVPLAPALAKATPTPPESEEPPVAAAVDLQKQEVEEFAPSAPAAAEAASALPESEAPHAAADAPPGDAPASLLMEMGRWVVEALEVTLGTIATSVKSGVAKVQGADNPIQFEDLVYALRQAADNSVHHLPPEVVAANHYEVTLDASSYRRLSALQERYVMRATEELRAYIATQRYLFDARYDRLVVTFVEASELTKHIDVLASFKKIPPAVTLIGPGGETRSLYAGDRLVIGRGDKADWRIEDLREQPVVSRLHCTVEVSDDGHDVTVHDNESTNGTYLNGDRASRAKVGGDAEILLGRNRAGVEGPKITLHRSSQEAVP